MYGESAIFVVLKPGIGFEEGVGSYVSAAGVVQANDEATDAVPLPSYRHRVLGVFDDDSGQPLKDVSVIDAATETRAATTVTGTVSLAFLHDGVNTIRRKRAAIPTRSGDDIPARHRADHARARQTKNSASPPHASRQWDRRAGAVPADSRRQA